ncbi:unnamed protein product [Ceratitis capitata]|uniref:(Mediterranean fruit fly) hypothetical protein n=1 Tax=Ceratitis capitata TaxID=7213 RepID=A0A811VBM1_CERCA|nr:unnamed protein product [Ceratitis capitata]
MLLLRTSSKSPKRQHNSKAIIIHITPQYQQAFGQRAAAIALVVQPFCTACMLIVCLLTSGFTHSSTRRRMSDTTTTVATAATATETETETATSMTRFSISTLTD